MSPFRRTVQLFLGLLGYALSMAMLLHAGQGGMPWDVLHQGIVERTGLPFGVVVVALSALALLAWIPLRQRPGIGTLANVVVIGVSIDPAIALVERVVPSPGTGACIALALGGVVLNGVATSAYLGVRLGPGPRDGLMTGLVARTGRSVRLVRTLIEVVVVSLGWALGGTLGWATLAYAVGVGPIVQTTSRWFAPRRPAAAGRPRRATMDGTTGDEATGDEATTHGAPSCDVPADGVPVPRAEATAPAR